jgi:hypothetical protein
VVSKEEYLVEGKTIKVYRKVLQNCDKRKEKKEKKKERVS